MTGQHVGLSNLVREGKIRHVGISNYIAREGKISHVRLSNLVKEGK